MGVPEQTSVAAFDYYAWWNHHECAHCFYHLCFYPDDMGRKEDSHCVYEVWSARGG